MTLPGLLILLMSVICSLPCSAATPSDPFDVLESKLQNEVDLQLKEWNANQNEQKRARLITLYSQLHDLRNHQTFASLWQSWHKPVNNLTALYIGSGSHLAPLEFVHSGTLKNAWFLYTEIDGRVLPRIESLLSLMAKEGFYTHLTESYDPGEDNSLRACWTEETKAKGEIKTFEQLVSLLGKCSADPGQAPFIAHFGFQYEGTHVKLDVLINVKDQQPGSTAYYRIRELEESDLIITHDWDSSPQKNLSVLYDLISSNKFAPSPHRLCVMMEDLRKNPFPISLDFLHPVAASTKPYGHAATVTLPDGSPVAAELGPPLYGGAAIVEPDTGYFSSLSDNLLTSFFDFLLFYQFLFDRLNVDFVDARLFHAPPLLDLGVGYGYRDIRGNDLRGNESFLTTLAKDAIVIGKTMKDPMMQKEWCSALTVFHHTLELKAQIDPARLSETAEGADSPFLKTDEMRGLFHEILLHLDEYIALKANEKKSIDAALKFLQTAPSCP